MPNPRSRRRTPAKPNPSDATPQSTQPPAAVDSPASVKETKSVSPSFDPSGLDSKVITIPLERQIAEQEKVSPGGLYKVIIDLNLMYHGGRLAAGKRVRELLGNIVSQTSAAATVPEIRKEGINEAKSEFSEQYLFGQFTEKTIRALVVQDKGDQVNEPSGTPDSSVAAGSPPSPSANRRASCAIHLIWPDFAIGARLTKSLSTVKADAAHLSFSATGTDIVWAVIDSGIQGDHVHFKKYKNLETEDPLRHRDFTALGTDEKPLEDLYGHGTHVAGIIAGERKKEDGEILAISREQVEGGDPSYQRVPDIEAISGMAPRCKLLSLRVLDKDGQGDASSLIAAINYVQQLNGNGRRIVVQGVNVSAGYPFHPEWFACGQSPVCVEVDRLVRGGVVVVVAAGNTGYSYEQVYIAQAAGASRNIAGQPLSINDPGNAELAITVGSTHREMPHIYGISYFSSKGPTGDGRCKPDLVAPGEKIISCAAGQTREERLANVKDPEKGCDYAEDSGTSMATPHVSGVIAAFLSVRREYIGRAEEVKEIFTSSATDLGRDRYFQGKGLIDLMRAIQAV